MAELRTRLGSLHGLGRKRSCFPDVVAAYIAEHAGELSVSTLTRRLAAINKAHEMKNAMSPTKDHKVRLVMRGIRREHTTQKRQAAPFCVTI